MGLRLGKAVTGGGGVEPIVTVSAETGRGRFARAPQFPPLASSHCVLHPTVGILVEQQPPQGVFVCDHAGLVINTFSTVERFGTQQS